MFYFVWACFGLLFNHLFSQTKLNHNLSTFGLNIRFELQRSDSMTYTPDTFIQRALNYCWIHVISISRLGSGHCAREGLQGRLWTLGFELPPSGWVSVSGIDSYLSCEAQSVRVLCERFRGQSCQKVWWEAAEQLAYPGFCRGATAIFQNCIYYTDKWMGFTMTKCKPHWGYIFHNSVITEQVGIRVGYVTVGWKHKLLNLEPFGPRRKRWPI